MYDTERYNPESYSDFFPDHRTMRPPVPGTIARDHYEDDPEVATGLLADRSGYVLAIPQSLVQRMGGTEKLLERGQERFGIYCAPCHGLTGDGKGMVVCKREKTTDPCESRGFPPLPSYEDPRLRTMPDGQLFATITHGVRTMPALRSADPDQGSLGHRRLRPRARVEPDGRGQPLATGAEEVSTNEKSETPHRGDGPGREYRIPTGSRWAGAWKIAAVIGVAGLAAAAYGYTVDVETIRLLVPVRLVRPSQPRAGEPLLRDGALHHEGVVGRHGPARRGALHAADADLRDPGHPAGAADAASLPVARREARHGGAHEGHRGRARGGRARRAVGRRGGARQSGEGARRRSRLAGPEREADGEGGRGRGAEDRRSQALLPAEAVLPRAPHRVPAPLELARPALLRLVDGAGQDEGAREHGGRAEVRGAGVDDLRGDADLLRLRLVPVARRDLVLDDLRRLDLRAVGALPDRLAHPDDAHAPPQRAARATR